MQDRFVGDIGDFANNGLLRALCGTPEMRVDGLELGVIEYFNEPTHTDSKKSDGSKIEYLKVSEYNDSMYREYDKDLYLALRKLVGESLVSGNELKIDPAWARTVLPVDERYYDALVQPYKRVEWIKCAIKKIDDANIVFVNPDNGIATQIMCKKANDFPNQKRSTQHIYMDELQQISDANKSIIIYQHPPRDLKKDNRQEYTKERATFLQQELNFVCHVWAFWWHPIVPRIYFIVARTQEHKDKIEKRLESFRKSDWIKQEYFTEVEILKCQPS